MSQDDKPVLNAPAELNAGEAQAIGGGDCSINDYLRAIDDLKKAYDDLVEFTSYVIERVAGNP